MAAHSGGQIDTVMQEKRVFPPPAQFAARARIKSLDDYQELWNHAAADPPKFWAELAREDLHWFTPFTKALDWNEPFANWFVGGKTNVSYNCLDRNLTAHLGDRTAIIWEGEPGEERRLTYAELHREVCKFANVLKGLGVRAGDRVSIYMPMVPELAVAMLACARIGAIHSVVFGGFASHELATRIDDATPKLIVTASCGIEPGRIVAYKPLLEHALEQARHRPERTILLQRKEQPAALEPGRDLDWAEA